jgi:virulence factor Mce-like protein
MSDSATRDRFLLEVKRAAAPFFLYVLLVIGGLLVAAYIIGNLTGTKPWDSYTNYQAAFTDVKGVQPGSTSLRLAGVEVGNVASTRLVDGHPVLTLNLESQYAPLYRNARIEVRPVTPLEDMYVDIVSRGTKSAGVLGSNDVLPVSQTVSPVEISSVLDVFDTNTRQRLGALLDQLGAGLSGTGGANLSASFQAIAPFLVVADKMTAAMAEQRTELASLIRNFGGMSQELDLHDRQLRQFVTYANSTLGELATTSGPFAATIQALPGTLSAMSSAFSELRTAEGSLDPALASLGPVAAALPDGLSALTSFSQAATPALDALRPAANELKPLALVLKPTSQSLAGAFNSLKPEAPELNQITTLPTQGNCLTYIGQFLNRVISLTKFGDGVDNIAQARADVSVDLGNLSIATRPPSWRIAPICYHLPSGAPTS